MNIDLDERAAALGTIALETGGAAEEYELEFPEIEDEFNLLPETDDNLLSLHDARTKVFLTGAPSRTPSTTERTPSSQPFKLDDWDLLDDRSQVSEVDLHRKIDFAALEFDRARPAAEEEPDYRMPDWGGGDEGPGPSWEGWQPAQEGQLPEREPERVPGDISFPGGAGEELPPLPQFGEMPPPGPRAKRRFDDLFDAPDAIWLTNDFLRPRITNNRYYAGPDRDPAPKNETEVKRRKLMELPVEELAMHAILKDTTKPLRPLLREALEARKTAVHVTYGAEEPSIEVPRGLDYDTRIDNFQGGGGDYEMPPDFGAGGGHDFEPAWREPEEEEKPAEQSQGAPHVEPERSIDMPTFTPFTPVPSTSHRSSTDLEQLSENSLTLLRNFHNNLKLQKPDEPVSATTVEFGAVFGNMKRRLVANAFLSILELKSKDYLDVEQEEAYGPIHFKFLDRAIPISSPSVSV